MTQPDRIWELAVTDCSKCKLTLLDAIASATDDDIFQVNYITGESLDKLADLRAACLKVRNKVGFMFAGAEI